MCITYELQKNNSATEYYQLTRKLAEQLQQQMSILDKLIEAFANYIQHNGIEPVREPVEYAIELLDFAVLHKWIQGVLGDGKFRECEDSYPKWKESVEFMQKSGEFKEEIRRFIHWLGFFEVCTETEWECCQRHTWWLVGQLEEMGDRYLQPYLPKLPCYLEKHKFAWDSREDAGLILRDKSCYYINMLAAQMLNNCYRQDFVSCGKRYIFLPGCMARWMSQCQAQEQADGYVCASCSDDCQVNRLTKQYQRVRIVYHGSEMEKKKVETNEKIGVVGVACILNLISGGWKAKRLGYVPQCVILNECGCNIHWDKSGRVTSLDEEFMKCIAEIGSATEE